MEFVSCVLYFAVLGILSHVIGQAMPRRWFAWDRFPFACAQWEEGGAFYEKFRIQAWKDKMPDMSRFMPDMVPKKISLSASSQDIDMLLRETCVAEFVHGALCVLGFGCAVIWEGIGGRALSLLWLIGNIPFIMIQRYNRPRMQKLYAIIYHKESMKAAAI